MTERMKDDKAAKLAACPGDWTWDEQHDIQADWLHARAERDVWSGQACQEEMAAGNGPCGGCRHCLPILLREARAERDAALNQVNGLKKLYSPEAAAKLRAELSQALAKLAYMEHLQAQAVHLKEDARALAERVRDACALEAWRKSGEASDAVRNLDLTPFLNSAQKEALEQLEKHSITCSRGWAGNENAPCICGNLG